MRKLFVAVAVVVTVVVVAAGVYLLERDGAAAAELARMQSDPKPRIIYDSERVKVENPVDFEALRVGNPDICAWLTIPGTNVNQPILQSREDDLFYLSHDRDGNESPYGAIFTQSMNALDFSDPVTVVYGHDVDEPELLFRSLHNFEDGDFFAEHSELYVYLPGHVLTYEVVSAYEYDDRHILNSFDFSDESVRQAYFDAVLCPDSLLQHVREGVALDASEDRIIQLSTCMLDEFHGPHRFIVTGVLRDDQETE